MSDDFSNHPESLTEIRAGRNRDATIWTPRDALIDLLRRIDGGEDIDALVLVMRTRTKDGLRTGYNVAMPDLNTGLGMMVRAMHLMNEA